ncbi:SGNH/GDSL hydrolase family protein [Granulicella arctica]|uniref:Lysophospholipase L1-like esterase n=1 Tax=Granulicella arctica TaxID=940613 RepID=A0A7Y9PDG1_9BACT|nr:SGNH/GDSL hydrolase family protein [Granulicella arctica]NYF77896.1 lysophospholipase L1-like esterase [Granulicella arctica]
MHHRSLLCLTVLLSLCLGSFTLAAFAAKQPEHWVGTWATSPVGVVNKEGDAGSTGTTYREIVHVSLGGSSVRIVLTNEFGTAPLTIGAAHIALSAGQDSISLTTANALTFSGNPSITIPAGGVAVSDPVELKLPPLSDLTISLFVPAQPISQLSVHTYADQTSYTAPGNVVGERVLEQPTSIYSWPFLKGVDVLVGAESASVVTLGDSITDGALSTRDANARWPDVLAKRLHDNKKTAELGVLNEGIGGNRVLHDVAGPSALARFDRDVLSQAGVKYLVIMESINDIGHAKDPIKPYDVVSADDLIAGLDQLAQRAHIHGIRVIGATLTPYVGAKYASPAGEAMRQAVNQWIRTTKDFDGVIDFDKATRDPANPSVFLPSCDSGDHLHPADGGYKIMGDSIDLNLFAK